MYSTFIGYIGNDAHSVAVARLYNVVAFYGNVRYVLLTKRIKRLQKSVQPHRRGREQDRGGHGNGHGCECHDTYEHFAIDTQKQKL